jgi:hypothetical protein
MFQSKKLEKPERSSGPDCVKGIAIWGRGAISRSLDCRPRGSPNDRVENDPREQLQNEGSLPKSPSFRFMLPCPHFRHWMGRQRRSLGNRRPPSPDACISTGSPGASLLFFPCPFDKKGRDPNGCVSPCASDFFQPASEGTKTPGNRGRESHFHEKPRC